MSSLYNEIKPPHNYYKPQWDVYYEGFVTRFRYFYPNRNFDEVQKKIEEMVLKRRFKEVGEKKYWEAMRNDNNNEDAMPTDFSM
jgi:hypothetical protein